jgi:hypothetical protein
VRKDGQALLEALYAPRADVWRINHGWRRAQRRNGFAIDGQTGRWGKTENGEVEEDGQDPGAERTDHTGVKPYVTDSRNLLLLRPVTGLSRTEAALKSLAFAVQRGIQFVYQVEEQEVAVELIGQADEQRLLLWEAAEGGTGVWERLVADSTAFAEVAREALRICHFDPETGQPDPAWESRCARACYDCLLSYSNQQEHRHLDRHWIRDYLRLLTSSEAMERTGARSYDDQYRWLLERTDPHSSLERQVLDRLYRYKGRLPDLAQHRPADDVPAQTDFYYQREGLPGVCVLVDGPSHDAPEQATRDRAVREALEDRGFRVVVVSHRQPLLDQFRAYPEVFGVDETLRPSPNASLPELWQVRSFVEVVGASKADGEQLVEAKVPAWDPDRTVTFPLPRVPPELRDQVRPEGLLVAKVNIGAEDTQDLGGWVTGPVGA